MYTTILYRSGICPKWKVQVSIAGKYVFSESPGEEHTARYMCAVCPIAESSRLKVHEQDPKYKLMRCDDESACPLMNGFPEQMDVRDGYTLKP